MTTTTFGSDAWEGTKDLEDGVRSFIDEGVRRCLKDTQWDSLKAKCSELREGISCKMSEKFSFGTQNLVRLVEFENDVKWVARVALEDVDQRMAASLEDQMITQVATYMYLKQNTNIPVPEVHGFSARRTAEVGPPYMLLDYVHGTTADKCGLNNEQSLQVLVQVAEIMVELATHRFDKIGALSLDEAGNVVIGQDLETGGGPYKKAQEYYSAVSKHRFQFYANRYFRNNLDAKRATGLHLPSLFNQMMEIMTDCATDCGPFPLTNTDIGFHNLLLDENLNIVGMIDCDGVKAAPIYVVAQYPHFSEITIPVPGLITEKPMARKVLAKGTIMFGKFLKMIEAAEKRHGDEVLLAIAMGSDGARLFEGLEAYMSLQDWVNAEWVEGYWYMYYRALRGPSGAVEFSDAALADEGEGSEDDTNCSEIQYPVQKDDEHGESMSPGAGEQKAGESRVEEHGPKSNRVEKHGPKGNRAEEHKAGRVFDIFDDNHSEPEDNETLPNGMRDLSV